MTLPRFILVASFASSGGCAPRAVSPPLSALAEASHGPSLDGGLFLQGFDVTWRAFPHRINCLAIGAHGGVSSDDGVLYGVLSSEVRGGTWASGVVASDTPRVTVRYGAVEADSIDFIPGTVSLDLSGHRGHPRIEARPAEGATDVVVSIPGLQEDDAVAVWLTGFEVTAGLLHPHGFTPHGLAIQIGPPTVQDGRVIVHVYGRFEAAPVLDRAQSLEEYAPQVRVDFVVVRAENAVASRFSLQSSLDERVKPADLTRKREPARIPIRVHGEVGPPRAVAGLSGFDIDLLEDGPVNGRYVRSLTVGIEDGLYDGARGSYDALVAMRFTNSGKLARPAKIEADAEFTLLQFDDTVSIREGRWEPVPGGPIHATSYPDMAPLLSPVENPWRYGWSDSAVADED